MPRRPRIASKRDSLPIGVEKSSSSRARVPRTSQIDAKKMPSSPPFGIRGPRLISPMDIVPLGVSNDDGDRKRIHLLPLFDDSDSCAEKLPSSSPSGIPGRMSVSALDIAPLGHLHDHDGDRSRFRSLSSLHAVGVVLTLICPWICAGPGPVCLASTFSSFVSVIIFILIASRSDTTPTAYECMLVTWALIFAIFTYAVSPFCKMVILYISTICNAALLGYAMKEHRTHTCSDASNFNVSSYGKKKTPPPFISMSILSVMCAVRVVWISWRYAAANTAAAIVESSLTLITCMFLWTGIVHVWLLRSSVFSGDCLTMLFCYGMIIFWVFAGIVDDLFVVLCWLTVMGIGACLGYTIAMYHCYKGPLQIRSTKPSRDGGMLLEGAQVEQLSGSRSDPLEGADADQLIDSDGAERSQSSKKIKDAPCTVGVEQGRGATDEG